MSRERIVCFWRSGGNLKIFVTGGTGVIGRRAVPLLRQRGHEVTAVGRKLDLFSPDAVNRALAGHEVVINLATHIPPGSRAFFPWAWRENSRIRSVASRTLVDAALAAGARRFIQESFAPVYADGGEGWLDENAPRKPALHTRAVLDAEAAAARFGNAVVLRFGWFYGADGEFTQAAIASVRKGIAPAFGGPDGYHPALSHDDAAAAVVAALTAPAGTYNVGDDEPLRRREHFDILAAALGVKPPKFPPRWIAKVAGSVGETLARSLRISNHKMRSETEWRPKHPSVREGWPVVVAAL